MLDASGASRDQRARQRHCSVRRASDLHGRDWLDFIHGDAERERARLMLPSALAGGRSREREFDARDTSGERRRIYWRCIARRAADGSPAGWLCSGADVTDQARRAEDAHAGAGPADARGAPGHHRRNGGRAWRTRSTSR